MNILLEKSCFALKLIGKNKDFLYKKCTNYPLVNILFLHDSSRTHRSPVVATPPRLKADPIITALKSASSLSDALNVIGIHAQHMEKDQLTFSLRTLNSLQKSSRDDPREIDVLNSKEFLFLFRRLKKQLYAFDVNDIIDALKTVTFFKVPFNSSITMKLLHLIKNEINSLSMNQIMFLAFLLRQHPKSSVVDALKMALPIVFETQVKIKLERSNVTSVVDALIFCSKNKSSQEACDYIVSALYDLDQLEWLTMDPKKARSIVIALADLAVSSPIYEAVFKDAAEVIAKNIRQFLFGEIDQVFYFIIQGLKNASYLNETQLFDATNNLDFDKWSMEECSIFLRKLNSAGFVNHKLLDNLAEKILDEPETFREGRYNLIKTFVTGLSLANYRTDHWNLLKDLIPAATVLQNIQPKEPWIPLCVDLTSIDVFSDNLISQVFNPWFLEIYLSREYNKLDLLQLLRLYQYVSVLHKSYSGIMPPNHYIEEAIKINGANATISPLIGALEMELGKNCVLSRCKTSLGHYIDHVVVLKPGGEPVQFPNESLLQSFVKVDEVDMPTECLRVAVLFLTQSSYNSLKQLRGASAMSVRTLEALGFATVSISAETWLSLPDWEKCPYLAQQIRLSCSDLYQKEQVVVE